MGHQFLSVHVDVNLEIEKPNHTTSLQKGWKPKENRRKQAKIARITLESTRNIQKPWVFRFSCFICSFLLLICLWYAMKHPVCSPFQTTRYFAGLAPLDGAEVKDQRFGFFAPRKEPLLEHQQRESFLHHVLEKKPQWLNGLICFFWLVFPLKTAKTKQCIFFN